MAGRRVTNARKLAARIADGTLPAWRVWDVLALLVRARTRAATKGNDVTWSTTPAPSRARDLRSGTARVSRAVALMARLESERCGRRVLPCHYREAIVRAHLATIPEVAPLLAAPRS